MLIFCDKGKVSSKVLKTSKVINII